MTTPRNPRLNPYIGPRSFGPGEQLYGRDTETRKLANLLGAERVVLLHSPSGAGKTSLVQAALIPRMRERKFHVRPVARVNHEAAQPLSNGYNRYVFSVLSSLESAWPDDQQIPDQELAGLTLPAYLARRPKPDGVSFELLIFDQFEEVLTLDPTDQAAKHGFFAQLGDLLEDRTRWALFSMREDFLGALAPYLIPIPNRLSATFRLDLLGVEAARQALQRPVRAAGAEFDDSAAQMLVDDLRRVQVQRPDGTLEVQLGPHVEPVQLQVVGYRLWESLADDDSVIDQADLAVLGDVGHALAEYYAGRVVTIAQLSGVSERAVREWCDRKLITEQGIRGQVLMGKQRSEGLENSAVRLLENAHLVRAEKRGGATWYELAHDRLIEPMRSNNAAWFAEHLSLLQRQAQLWADERRLDGLLLRGKELKDAEAWAAAHASEVGETERDFLDGSRAARAARERERRATRWIRALAIGALIGLALAITLAIYALNQQSKVVEQLNRAQTAEARAKTNADTAQTAEAQAKTNADTAQTAEAQAKTNADTAQTAQAAEQRRAAEAEEALRQLMVSDAQAVLAAGDLDLARALAITALRADPNLAQAESVLVQASLSPGTRRRFEGYAAQVWSVAFSPDGKMLASGSNDQTVRLWDVATGRSLRTLQGHTDYVTSVAFSPDGKMLASGSSDQTVRLWDVATGHSLRTLQGHSPEVFAVAFSPDGKILASGSIDGTMRLWDVATGQSLRILRGHSPEVYAVAFSPDGKTVVSGSNDRTLRLWDVATGQSLRILQGHTGSINAVAFSPDGKTVISGSDDHTLRLWDVAMDQSLRTLTVNKEQVYSVAFSPDGKMLASGSGDQTVRLWDVATGQSLRILQGHTNGVTSVAFSPDGKTVVSGSYDHTLQLWDVATGQSLRTLQGHTDYVTSVAFSPDGKMLASGSGDQAVRLWDVATGQSLRTLQRHNPFLEVTSVAFSPDGKTLASGIGDGTLWLWDVATGQSLRTLQGHTFEAVSVAFSPDGKTVVSGSWDGTLRLWPVLRGKDLLDWTLANRYVPDLTEEQRARYGLEPAPAATPSPTAAP